ncbi:MAG: DPP IV N-terminal domain-containing protein [Rhodothermales bacterium]|nr:DPP IV N-terminal domain-containing protein [Rhodothermales bacterium]
MRMHLLLLALVALCFARPSTAQQPVTTEDYARAESFLATNTWPLVYRSGVRPTFHAGDRFWYAVSTPAGTEFVTVDPARKTRALAFEHDRLASALSTAADTAYSAERLPFSSIEPSADGRSLAVIIERTRYECDLRAYTCAGAPHSAPRLDRRSVPSPDGRLAAFIRDNNLWVRDQQTGDETPLTTDGVTDFGYATNNAGWTRSETPVVLWSPDSKKIATFQHDGRGVGEMYLTSTETGRPKLEAWKYPLPGDSLFFRIERVVIHVDDARVVRLQMPPDPHRGTTTDHIAGQGGRFLDVEWSSDSDQLAFVSSSRDHKVATLRVADPETGVVRDVLTEKTNTYFESGFSDENWRVLFETNEVLWFSERDNWGHMYLYDLSTGELKQQITQGEWAVLDMKRVDARGRTLYFTAGGREPGDPYFHRLYRIGMDGKNLRLLTAEDAHHTIAFVPSGDFFVDTYSTSTTPPVSVVKDTDGRTVVELERADISALQAAGWQPPIPFTTKARDGVTELHGLMYRPSNFDSTRSYPVLNYLYPGPQSGSVGTRSFVPARSDKQAVAELGFVVIEVDAMGTPGRSKSFHDAYYGNMGDNGLPDQIATIQQLADRHGWIDDNRVGIWGHSGGGFASAAGVLRYPDFYDVAVSSAGNHGNRLYEDDWGEKWQGLLEEGPDGTTNYDNQANQLVAGNLKGKLLLAHGNMDNNVPPYNTLALVDALIKANKDFDLLMIPNARHGFGDANNYFMRRRWDYFVRHLLGVEPPQGYEIGRRMEVQQPTG